MSTYLSDLSDRFRPLAIELIARCVESRILLRIIETRRTPERQKELVDRGVSWTLNSKHLTGDAIDLAPDDCLRHPNWSPGDPRWKKMGEIARSLGIGWGGDWTVGDNPHFEYREKSDGND